MNAITEMTLNVAWLGLTGATPLLPSSLCLCLVSPGKSNPRIRRHSKAWKVSSKGEREGSNVGGRFDRENMCFAAPPSSVDQGNHAAASRSFLLSFLILSGPPTNVGVRVRQWSSVLGTMHK